MIYTLSKQIGGFEIDLHGTLKVSAIFNLMQDAASQHAEQLGFGFGDFKEKKLMWVLSWARLDIIELPGFSETVNVKTWTKKQHKLFYLRDFSIETADGKIIAKATTAWTMLKSDTMRPTTMQREGLHYPESPENHAIDMLPEKIELSNTVYKDPHTIKRQVLYSDIDIHQHVNNARYIELILDCYNADEHKENLVKSISVQYKGESKFMDSLTISKFANENADYISIFNESKNKTVIDAKVIWRKYQ